MFSELDPNQHITNGKRPRRGRRKHDLLGRKGEARLQRERMLARSGMLPLDLMLAVLRDVALPLAVRMDAAKAAAQYIHPRLMAVEHSGSLSTRSANELTDEQLAEIAAQSALVVDGVEVPELEHVPAAEDVEAT